MPTETLAPPSRLESGILEGMDALTECPECRIGVYTLNVYRRDGRVKVACVICERARDYADAHTDEV